MTQASPTFEMYLKRYVQQQSTTRILWNEAKKKSKGIDTSIFKKGLGKELDKLLAVGLAAGDVIKKYGKQDAKSAAAVQEVKKQYTKVEKLINDYRGMCQKSAKWEHTPDKEKQEWQTLDSALNGVDSSVDNFVRPLIKG